MRLRRHRASDDAFPAVHAALFSLILVPVLLLAASSEEERGLGLVVEPSAFARRGPSVVVRLGPDGGITVEGREVGERGLVSAVRAGLRSGGPASITIEAHDEVPYRSVVALIDRLTEARRRGAFGASTVVLPTRQTLRGLAGRSGSTSRAAER